ncbi:MAG: hypothetical protein ACPGXK_01875 [Phycisphaerae bacterium]
MSKSRPHSDSDDQSNAGGASSSASSAVADVLELLPPNGVFELGQLWMILELMDRRKSSRDEQEVQRRETHDELTELIHRRAMQVEALSSLFLLVAMRWTLWILGKLGVLKMAYYEQVTLAMDRGVESVEKSLDEKERPFVKQRDEIAAERLVEERTQYVRKLKERFRDDVKITQYLQRYEEISLQAGQSMAEAALVGRRASRRAEREADLFKTNLTSFGAMISLGAFVKTVLFALLAFIGIYLLVPFSGSEEAPRTQAARLISGAIGAAIALAISFLRLFFGFRRMTRVQRDAQRRGAEARLAYLKVERQVAVECWNNVIDLYELLTRKGPPASVDQGQRDRLRRIDHAMLREEDEILANSPEKSLRQRVRGMFEGMLQGDIGDAL